MSRCLCVLSLADHVQVACWALHRTLTVGASISIRVLVTPAFVFLHLSSVESVWVACPPGGPPPAVEIVSGA
ncbi:hypothetical protein PF010_g27587, partial [Phytophthora fragariae]